MGMNNRVEIVDAIRRLQKLYDVSTISFMSNIQRTVILAHGWYVACNRTATAIMVLETRGLGHEAAPLRRSLMEHAVGLVWLAEATEDAVNSLVRGYQNLNVKKLKEVFEKVSPDQVHCLVGILDVTVDPSSEDQYLAFSKLCKRFGVERIYGGWLLNTALSHATYASAVAYVDNSIEELGLTKEPHSHPDSALEIATLLLLASFAFNSLLDDRPWEAVLKKIEAQIIMATKS